MGTSYIKLNFRCVRMRTN